MKVMQRHLILTVHGIRTYGRWQERLEGLLKTEIAQSGHDIEIDGRHYRYGFFTLFSFLIPFLRNLAVRRFKMHLEAVLDEGPFDRINIVAHSFGTYLTINALASLNPVYRTRIDTVILCGSVLPPDWNLSQTIGANRVVRRLINDCGNRDGVLLLTLLVYGVGMGGRLGLHGFQGKHLVNRHFNIGHSGYFEGSPDDQSAFMRRWWVPLLLGDDHVAANDDRPEKPALVDRIWRTLGENSASATLSIYAVLVTIFAGSLWYLRERAVEAEKVALEERDLALRTQSRFLADLAKQSAALGNGATAINLSLEALPDLSNKFKLGSDRPYVVNAEGSLDTGLRTPREIAIFACHTAPIQSSALSHNESQVVTASWDGTACLFNASGDRRVILRGHTDRIWSSEFSPDDAKVVTAAWDGTARIWDTRLGNIIHVLNGHHGKVWSAAFSPDGRAVVTGGEDSTIRVWDVQAGTLLHTLQEHNKTVIKVGFSPDGRWIISVSWDSTARIWDAKTGKRIAVFADQSGPLTGFSISPNSSLVVLTGRSHDAVIWEARSGRPVQRLKGHTGAVTTAMFSPKGNFLITADGPPYVNDKTARVWDVATGRLISSLKGHAEGVTGASFSSDERLVVTASSDNTAAVWDVKSGQRQFVLSAHTDTVRNARFSMDGTRVLTWSDDTTARMWAINRGLTSKIFEHNDKVDTIVFVRNNELVVTASSDGTTRIWSLAKSAESILLPGKAYSTKDVAVLDDGTFFVLTLSDDGMARVWSGLSKALVSKLEAKAVVAGATTFSPDGTRVAAALENHSVGIFDMRTGRLTVSMIGHTGTISSVQFTSDGLRILTGSDDTTVRMWDAISGKQIYKLQRDGTNTMQRKGNQVVGVAINADGRRIVATYRDRIVYLWNAETMQRIGTFGNPTKVSNLAYPAHFSPDGRYVAAGFEQNSTGIWRADSGRLEHVLTQDAWVFGSRFSGDSRRLVTYSIDQTAHVWDVATGGELTILVGHTDNVYGADFNQRGDVVGTVSADGTARIWQLFPTTQQLVNAAKSATPRCLTAQERKKFFLEPVPPRWCITGAGLEAEKDSSKWRPK